MAWGSSKGVFETTNAILRQSKEGAPEVVKRDHFAWRPALKTF